MFRSWRLRITVITALITLVALVPGLASADSSKPSVKLPPNAQEVKPGVFYLGKAKDKGNDVEGYAIIHPRKSQGKGNGKGKGGGGKPASSSCFTFLAKGAKWKSVENFVVNAENTRGLDANTIGNLIAGGTAKWEAAAGGVNIFGSGTLTSALLSADLASPDGVNEVLFADIDSVGAIAVTIVWGRFGGRPQARELIEWDQVYDDVDFDWSLSGAAGAMDFDNIATHEIGHAAGMGHPADTCGDETMYRYADVGETKKRDLNPGDIAGVAELY